MNALATFDEVKPVVETPKAPLASSFPAHPASWYLFCHRKDLRNGPVAKRLLNRDLVAFQTKSGKVAVMDARCSHLGANLGCGKVVGETIQCPFHNWEFGCDGHCEKIPSSASIPAFARQQSFPVAELHGLIFFFNGNEALFPLPFFIDETPEHFRAARVSSFEADASWFMVAAQGFDRQHFETVHDRKLIGVPRVDCPTPFVRRNQWRAEIVGAKAIDRILKTVLGKNVLLTICNWGGTFYTVKAEFSRTCSYFLVSYRPIENERTHFDVIVFARKGVAALGLPIRRWLTRLHLEGEASQVRGTQYRPARLIPADADMIDCFRWLAALPQRPATVEIDFAARSNPNESSNETI